LAERFGADANVVASAQVLRIAIVVVVVPLALTCVAGDHATGAAVTELRSSSPAGAAALLAIAAAAGWIARRVRVPNAWGIAPLLASCVCAAAGLSLGNIPPALVHAGQLAIGWALGSRFSAGFFRAQPRFLFAVSAYTVAVLIASVVLGSVLGHWAD